MHWTGLFPNDLRYGNQVSIQLQQLVKRSKLKIEDIALSNKHKRDTHLSN